MAVLRIARTGNPVLAQVAAPVADPGAPEIRRLAKDMIETIEDIGASGLAAPKLFESRRVVVYRMIAARIGCRVNRQLHKSSPAIRLFDRPMSVALLTFATYVGADIHRL